jgi:hypothetical protein
MKESCPIQEPMVRMANSTSMLLRNRVFMH